MTIIRATLTCLWVVLALQVACTPKVKVSTWSKGNTPLVVRIWNHSNQPSGVSPNLLSGRVTSASMKSDFKFLNPTLGEYLYSDLPPGDYTIQVPYNCLNDDLSKGFNYVIESFTIHSGESKQIDIILGCQGGIYID